MSDLASRAAFELQVRGIQKPVVMSLGHRHNGLTGACFPSISRIAKDAGYISEDSVRRALKQLSVAGHIEIVKRWDGPLRLSNTYLLNFISGVLAHSEGVVARSEGGTRTQHRGVLAHSDPNKEYEQGKEQSTTRPAGRVRGTVLVSLLVKDGTFDIYDAHLEQDRVTFPGLDHMAEYRLMAGWCADNPTKRKTKIGARRFIHGWLSRALKEPNGSTQQRGHYPTNRAKARTDGNLEAFRTVFGDGEASAGPCGSASDLCESGDPEVVREDSVSLSSRRRQQGSEATVLDGAA